MPSYHVTFEDHKKIIHVTNKKDVLATAKAIFQIGHACEALFLQMFDPEWDDFVDVEPEQLPDRAKLLLRVKREYSYDIPRDEELKFEICPEIKSYDVEEFSSDCAVQNPEVLNLSESSDMPCKASEDVPLEPLSVNSGKETDMTAPWPLPFVLPIEKFSIQLRESLQQKVNLSKSLKSHLLDVLHDHIIKYSMYPTSSQYLSVAEALLNTYPYLSCGMTHSDALKLWRSSLSYKLRNRRREENYYSSFFNKRQKLPNDQHSQFSPESFSICRNNGAENWSKSVSWELQRETDEPIESHIDWMKMEAHKIEKNRNDVGRRMDLTFHRRREVIKNGVDMANLKALFPCLFDCEEMLKEFKRITCVDVEPTLAAGLEKYHQAILCLCSQEPLVLQCLSHMNHLSSEEEKAYMQYCAALLSLPSLFKEKLNFIICHRELVSNTTHPLIIFKKNAFMCKEGNFSIIAENQEICQPSGLLHAFSCLISCYHVLSIPYPKQINCTLIFIYGVLMNLKEKSNLPYRVLALLSKINTFVKT